MVAVGQFSDNCALPHSGHQITKTGLRSKAWRNLDHQESWISRQINSTQRQTVKTKVNFVYKVDHGGWRWNTGAAAMILPGIKPERMNNWYNW